MKTIFAIMTLVFCVVAAQAQSEYPIDAAQANCLKTQHGTMPRAKCYSDAFDAWEKDIAKTYADLRAAVSSSDKNAFEAVQNAWVKYRDAEFDLIAARYAKKKGTGYIAVRIILRIDVLKPRALQLEGELSQIKGTGDTN